MWGHLDTRRLPAGYPQFFTRAEGGHIWDANGQRYVDLMCSWGPIVLGHHNPVVDAAVARQTALGDCLNGPAPVMVELCEALVERVAHADWAMLQKNGGDATTACVMDRGRITRQGASSTLINDPGVRQAYLGALTH
jgi:glutamate-1-semialdehyde 2,1-aminomutase